MSYSQMVSALAKPGAAIVASLTPEAAHLLHMAVGISGEVAELIEKDADVKEELGDIEFYMEGMRQGTGLTVKGRHSHRDENGFMTLVIAAGMILDTVKKHAVYNKPLDRDALDSYMRDMETGMAMVRESAGITREECIAANMNKLGKRYSSGTYSNEQAQARADKQ